MTKVDLKTNQSTEKEEKLMQIHITRIQLLEVTKYKNSKYFKSASMNINELHE